MSFQARWHLSKERLKNLTVRANVKDETAADLQITINQQDIKDKPPPVLLRGQAD